MPRLRRILDAAGGGAIRVVVRGAGEPCQRPRRRIGHRHAADGRDAWPLDGARGGRSDAGRAPPSLLVRASSVRDCGAARRVALAANQLLVDRHRRQHRWSHLHDRQRADRVARTAVDLLVPAGWRHRRMFRRLGARRVAHAGPTGGVDMRRTTTAPAALSVGRSVAWIVALNAKRIEAPALRALTTAHPFAANPRPLPRSNRLAGSGTVSCTMTSHRPSHKSAPTRPVSRLLPMMSATKYTSEFPPVERSRKLCGVRFGALT